MVELRGNPCAHLTEYELRHLAAHLEDSGRVEDLHRLLALETDEKRNGWYDVREASSDIEGYLADIARAWQCAESTYDPARDSECTSSISLQCRYALIRASISSLASSVPPTLIRVFVEKGLWEETQGLAYARSVPNVEKRVEALFGLAPHFPEPERARILQDVLEIVQQSGEKDAGTEVTDSPIAHFPEGVLRDALAAAWKTVSKDTYSITLAKLGYPKESLQVVSSISEDYLVAPALAGLAPHLPDDLFPDALDIARESGNDRARAQALVGLVPYLPETLLKDSLDIVREMKDESARADAFVGLAPYLPESLFPSALKIVRKIRRIWNGYEPARARARALVGLAPYLPKRLLPKALRVARRIRETAPRAQALAGLAPYYAEPERTQLLRESARLGQKALRIVRNNITRGTATAYAEALMEVVPYLNEPERTEAWREAMQAVGGETTGPRTQAVINLAVSLAELGHPAAALSATREIRYRPDDYISALVSVGTRLVELGYLQEALLVTQELDDYAEARRETIARLVPRLETGVLPEALRVARRIGDESDYVKTLTNLAPHLPEQHLPEILSAIRQTRDSSALADALASIAPKLPEPLLREALAEVKGIWSEDDRIRALVGLAPRLAELGYPDEALATVRGSIPSRYNRRVNVPAVARLLPHLPEPLRNEVLQEALAAAWALEEGVWFEEKPTEEDLRTEKIVVLRRNLRAEALISLVPHLLEAERNSVIMEALVAARAIEWRMKQASVWAEAHKEAFHGFPLYPCSRKEHEDYWGAREMAAWSALKWKDVLQAEALTALSPYLSDPLLEQALAAAQELEEKYLDRSPRAEAVAGLVPRMAELGHFEEALEMARGIGDALYRVAALARLIIRSPESLKGILLHEALVAAREIRDENYQSAVLAHLSSLPRQYLYSLWRSSLHRLAARTRKDLLADVRALEPVIASLGGEQAVEETFHAIQDVVRWWP